jgi:hypothetical protein
MTAEIVAHGTASVFRTGSVLRDPPGASRATGGAVR